MRSFFTNKLWIVFVSVLAVGALMGLAIGLKNIPFRSAQAFGRDEAQAAQTAPIDMINTVMSIPLKTQVGFWVLVVTLFVLLGMLLSSEMRKRLLRMLLQVAVTYWAFWLLFSRYPDILSQLGLWFTAHGASPSTTFNGAPVPVFTPPQSISWTAYLVSFGIAVLLIILAWKLNTVWRELNTPADSSVKKLAGIARSSLRDLSSGRDSTDVIMNCYYRMSDVVLEKKQINRNTSMTPSEFVLYLEQAGLPADAVQRLTRLFESARYGSRKLDSLAVNEAVTCLTTILRHCGEVV